MRKVNKLALAAAGLAACLFLSACGGTAGSSQSSSPSQGGTSQTASQPTNGKSTLIVGEQFDLASIDPAGGMLDDTQVLVYEALVGIDADFNQVPALAESWAMSDDGTEWTLNLRKNVTFHDGEPFNADAVVKNLERLAGYPLTSIIDNMQVLDDHTLVLTLSQPSYTVPSELARTTMSMVSPAAFNEDGVVMEAAGTGPYKLDSWTPDAEYSFVANEAYWGGAPALKAVTFKVITDPQARALALTSGEIDMMSGYQSLAAIKQLMDDPGFQIFKKTQNTSAALFFNLAKAPLNSLAVRKAITQALDMDTIVTSLLPGLASPPQGFFSPAYGDLVNPDIKMNDYDPDAAAALLEDDGWAKGDDGIYAKGGQRLSVALTYNAGNSEDGLIAPAMQDMLGDFGIEVTLNAVEGAAMDGILEGKTYDMVMTGQSFIPTDDPTFNYANGYWHSNSYYNIYSSPALDAMIDTLKTTMDGDIRRQLHWDIQAEIMAQVPTMITYHRNSVRLASAQVQCFDVGAGCWHVNIGLKDITFG